MNFHNKSVWNSKWKDEHCDRLHLLDAAALPHRSSAPWVICKWGGGRWIDLPTLTCAEIALDELVAMLAADAAEAEKKAAGVVAAAAGPGSGGARNSAPLSSARLLFRLSPHLSPPPRSCPQRAGGRPRRSRR